jgi:thiamine pyrophosphate-dependent acetolactate synthase large subunit-like protein
MVILNQFRRSVRRDGPVLSGDRHLLSPSSDAVSSFRGQSESDPVVVVLGQQIGLERTAVLDLQEAALQADGSALYTVQGLWTQARENLKVLTCIWSNRTYAILRGELAAVGVRQPGRSAIDMLSLDRPAIDWVKLARGFGVEARRVETLEDFTRTFQAGLQAQGPYLIEVML